ncbi:IclR family transcriptional regulator [Desulfosporosinus sp.]|uniref:IclR family transcriptional regulator n=1 Tax=Desulfosporosinus sp. TaxID=157907 RepID=UPI000E924B7A|nr:IclR family transcriptional regulator [Desulfosporosinus sp.]MBC2722459.1 IclR family transcriptional regulator [Desulfosporosinus sp.]MBC2728772.1 IclR family transcriptional regulator [Desulfosporosinus sp.]HBV87661.1 IclR family transcriptional regulator [Desulfosporosinus sp.]
MSEKYVQTLERSLDVLEVLAHAEEPLGVTEIGSRISLHKSTVHRILQTLCHRGYVERKKENDRYQLGIKIIELGIRFFNDLEIRKVAAPVLSDLVKVLDEVVHLVLPDDGEIVYIDRAESSQVVSMHSKVGRRAPMHCTAVGKALLSTLPEEEVRHILELKGMTRYTPNTITDPEILLTGLRTIKESKISIEKEENEIGIICLGTPIFDYSGQAIGAISVSGPASRITEKGIEWIGEELKKSGEIISAKLGFSFYKSN